MSRTTFDLDSDVRKFLEKTKNEYQGMTMTSTLHLCARYCRDNNVIDNLLQKDTPDEPPEEDGPTHNGKDTPTEEVGRENVDETTSEDRKRSSSSGVSFNDLEHEAKEQSEEEVPDTQGPDNDATTGDEPPEQDESKGSAASRFLGG